MVDFSKVPVERMRPAVERYLNDGLKPADFLTGVICNNLRQAVMYADSENLANLKNWILFFHWEAPGNSWGSRQEMEAWMKAFEPTR